jgi:endothelin-converting enzyme
MDTSSAEAAKKKAEAIIPKVGYPLTPDTTNPESLQRWYAPLKVDEGDFFGTVLRATVIENQRMWGSLGRQRDRQSWEMYPQSES